MHGCRRYVPSLAPSLYRSDESSWSSLGGVGGVDWPCSSEVSAQLRSCLGMSRRTLRATAPAFISPKALWDEAIGLRRTQFRRQIAAQNFGNLANKSLETRGFGQRPLGPFSHLPSFVWRGTATAQVTPAFRVNTKGERSGAGSWRVSGKRESCHTPDFVVDMHNLGA